LAASLIAGISWIALLSTLNVSAQVALPEWVRGRGLALFMTVYFGAHTVGSAVWGQVAALLGLPLTHFIAAAGALLTIPLTWRWHLQTVRGSRPDAVDALAGANHQPGGRGGSRPVLVTVEYRIVRKTARRSSPRSTA